MPVSATSSAHSAHRTTTSSPLLREGARGPAVSRMQHLLRAKGYRIEVDGAFGPRTAAAVRAFQQRKGLAVDGVVGPHTWGALGTRSTGGTSPAPAPAGTRAVTGYQNGRAVSVRLASIGGGKWLNARAAPKFLEMTQAARRAGIHLSVSSAFRTMDEQRYLYHLYQTGRGNLAARPGYSNHQMGLSVDLGNIGGYGTNAYNWLKHNAPRYGFYNDVGGEFWHWTYKR